MASSPRGSPTGSQVHASARRTRPQRCQGSPAGPAGSTGFGEEGRLEKRRNGVEDAGRACRDKLRARTRPPEALYGIVVKPEDVLYAMLTMHRKDGSNSFTVALKAFGVTWERKSRGDGEGGGVGNQ